ncbi:O-antigen ligase family protein [Marinilactibacillus psychrotolerans]|nr:O-antigen ligase family protein [Marinilactibacillus psychrotolerans]
MKLIENENKIFKMNTLLFSILLVSTMMYAFEQTRSIGLVALAVTLAIPVFYFITNLNKVKVNKLMAVWIIYIFYGVLNLLYNFSDFGVSVFLKHSILLFFVVILSQYKISDYSLDKVSKYFTNLYILILFLVVLNELFFSVELITQFLYKMAIMCTYFSIIRTGKVYKYSFLTIAVLSITSTRSAILSILLFLLIYNWLEAIKKSKIIYKFSFIIGIIILVGLPILYSQLQYSNLGIMLNEYSRELFSKNFFSGRQYIWEYTLSFIRDQPIFGYGYSNDVLLSLGITASTHNLYLSLLLQGGIILLMIFIMFMYQIWIKYFYYVICQIKLENIYTPSCSLYE